MNSSPAANTLPAGVFCVYNQPENSAQWPTRPQPGFSLSKHSVATNCADAPKSGNSHQGGKPCETTASRFTLNRAPFGVVRLGGARPARPESLGRTSQALAGVYCERDKKACRYRITRELSRRITDVGCGGFPSRGPRPDCAGVEFVWREQ